MPKRFLRSASYVCLAVITLAVNTRSQDLVSAKVLSSEGPVEIRRASQGVAKLKKINFVAGEELKSGDRISTGWGGRLVLGLSDGSLAVMGERTTVEIKSLSGSPRTVFNILRGNTRIHIERMGGRPNPYRVNTPTAVIAVRGTLFDVLAKESETRVFVHEGEVAVSSLLNTNEEVLLRAGQTTRVRRARAPIEPELFRPGRNDDLFRRPVVRRFDAADGTAVNSAAVGLNDASAATRRNTTSVRTPIADTPAKNSTVTPQATTQRRRN
jgi:hypothetical protein